jgi:hypothetical protein
MTRRKIRNSENLPSTSRQAAPQRSNKRIASSSDESEADTSEVQRKKPGISEAELETLSNNMVKYFLNFTDMKIPVKRSAMSAALSINTKNFLEVLEVCKRKLLDVYGLEVSEAEHNKAKVYIVTPDKNYFISSDQMPLVQRQEMSLLFIILSYIFMKGGSPNEG